jgi:hypothetical protein
VCVPQNSSEEAPQATALPLAWPVCKRYAGLGSRRATRASTLAVAAGRPAPPANPALPPVSLAGRGGGQHRCPAHPRI